VQDRDWISFTCVELNQPVGTSYVGAIDSRDLVRISYADVRRIEQRDIEALAGIQRPLNLRRVEELKKYVTNIDAAFPTGIILAIDSENAIFDEKSKVMRIKNDMNVAQIIDGQHRIAGLIGYTGNAPFYLNVTIFISMEKEDQALVFATINLKQTSVSKSLAYDLFEFAETRSPQKTCHNVARALNGKEESPFFHRIMILGVATGRPTETLTQAAFIDPLLPYLSRDPMTDRDRLKRGLPLDLVDPSVVRVQKLIFRNMFIEGRDSDIAQILWNYFAAVEDRWPDAWSVRQQGLILNRTTGFRALMRFLYYAYLSIGQLDSIVSKSTFAEIFSRVRLEYTDFTPEEFKPGTSGQGQLFRKLIADTRIDEDAPWRAAK
jgi:DGQHR domain-containing protein